MYQSLKAGEIIKLESLPTLSDATAGGIEEDAITFKMCQKVVDEICLISEDRIRNAIKLLVENHQMIVEGAAAMTLGTLLEHVGII